MIFLKIILPLGWCVGTWCCRDLCHCDRVYREDMRYERLIANCSDIHDCFVNIRLHRSTLPTWYRFVRRHLPVASSTLVFHAVGRRASSYFLGPGRARATTAAAPMTLLRPASLPLPRQRLFLRWSSGGTPFDPSVVIASVVLLPLCRAFHIYNSSYLSIYVR